MDSPLHEPQRLSALYQYHNAPEVAPAHGLEYDDTIYPSSDKYPVISERHYNGSSRGNYNFANDNRPPRIIFGMKVRTFLIVALVMVVIVVGAAVGGALGGQQLRNNQDNQPRPEMPSSTTATVHHPSSTSTFSAATPTYTPLSDCPLSNNTTYTSSGSSTSSRQTFTKFCSLANPLSQNLSSAFVYSFSDCIELCASYNTYNNNNLSGGSSPASSSPNCTAAVYQPAVGRPVNCYIGNSGDAQASGLDVQRGTDVAILNA